MNSLSHFELPTEMEKSLCVCVRSSLTSGMNKSLTFSHKLYAFASVCWCMALASPFDDRSLSLCLIALLFLSCSLYLQWTDVCFTLNVFWFIACAVFICYYWTSTALETEMLTLRTWCFVFMGFRMLNSLHNALTLQHC